ncbi:Auxin-responsive protein IAA19 [Triticum urartu]|uniref:Auxin-responsive protein n=1 Tax=Triticum urartu TaxID=4572 RepID=M8AHI9_TRIUA|nr:Auxin-responsive protein IAA19 [Triticum urartu]
MSVQDLSNQHERMFPAKTGHSTEDRPSFTPKEELPPKAQVVGWPPVRSYRKNTLAANATKTKAENEGRSEAGCCYVKVSMDGAPYLRKVDLKTYSSYDNLSLELEKMFSCFITGKSSSCKTSTRDRLTDGSRADALQDQEYVLTYEDKDADWMLVGDLPWDLFTTTCRKLRIMRGSDAAGMDHFTCDGLESDQPHISQKLKTELRQKSGYTAEVHGLICQIMDQVP